MTGVESLSKRELLELLETFGQLSAQTSRQTLVQMILNTACRMTGSPDGAVYLLDPERGGLYFAAAEGESGPELLDKWGEQSSQRVPSDESNAGEAFTKGITVVNQQSSRFKEVDRQTGKKSRAILSVPLRARGKSIGVLQVLNKQDPAGKLVDYAAQDLAIVEQIGKQAGMAIDNAQLMDKLLAHMGLYSRADSADLVERVNQPARPERLSLLFADMRGFTQLCQSQQTMRTQKIVNDLLTMFADQVLTFGGLVNKFLGDAVFAIFRHDDGPKQAVRCAFGMLDRFESLRHHWDDVSNEDLSFLDLGIGIVTDEVALGAVGSASVRDFTAIGTPVNLANAFQSAARSGKRILADQETWRVAKDLIADAEGPILFELRKPGQQVGVKYRQYHLKRLMPEIPVRVFVSHNRHDRDLANLITEQLAKCGIETWYSPADILPAEDYVEQIRVGLIKSDWVVVIVSANSAKSEWVRAEVKTAVKDPRFQERILPVLVDDSDPALISHDITRLQAIDGRTRVSNMGETIRDYLVHREKQLRS